MTQHQGSSKPATFEHHDTVEKLLLWAIRIWVKSLQNKTNAHGVLSACFRQAGATDAHIAFDGMMSIITNFASRQIDVRCPKCPNTSSDEMRMVGAIAARQNQTDPLIADEILGPLVQPAGLRLLREPVMNLAEALLVAELLVRPSHKASSVIADNLEIEPDYGDDFVTIH